MAPGQGFHLRGLQDAARALSEICEVQCGTPSGFPPVRRGRRRSAVRPMRDRSTPALQMVNDCGIVNASAPCLRHPERVLDAIAQIGYVP